MTGSPGSLADAFREVLEGRVEPRVRGWFGQAVISAGDRAEFLGAFAAASRRLGRASLDLNDAERIRLGALGVTWPVDGWGIDDFGRITLLVTVAPRWPEAGLAALVEDCYGQGDSRERQAVLRALPLLPKPERFVPLAVDACRTHIQPLFEAIACENPYPAEHFPELNFNQMVLKALFVGVALDRIVGLNARVTPELRHMARDYASERRAAGRTVPVDAWWLAGQREEAP